MATATGSVLYLRQESKRSVAASTMIPLNEIYAIDLEPCTAAITIIQRMKDALQPHLEDMLNRMPHVTFLPTKEFNIKTRQFPISNTFC